MSMNMAESAASSRRRSAAWKRTALRRREAQTTSTSGSGFQTGCRKWPTAAQKSFSGAGHEDLLEEIHLAERVAALQRGVGPYCQPRNLYARLETKSVAGLLSKIAGVVASSKLYP